MSKVFLIFFPLFFFFFSAGNSHRLSGSGPCREAAPTASPAYRPSAPATRGCLPSPPKPPYLGKFLPSPFARRSRVCQGCAPGGWRASAGRENRGIGAAPHPAPPSHFFSNFVFIFFFFPSPRVFFDLPLPPAVLVARDLRCQPRCGSRAGRERGRELSASAGGCGGGVARPTEGIYFPTFPLSPNGIVVPRRNTLLNG